MNLMWWVHQATRGNLSTLESRGVVRVGPGSGELACGEVGSGRMSEPLEIVAAIEHVLVGDKRLAGKRVLVTSGPTREPIDPVRYISNHSSGKQGHAIAAALAALGAETVLVSGPTQEPSPAGVKLVSVETAAEMLAACEAALPVDIAVMAAAVADWRVETAARHKLKKDGGGPPVLRLAENPDILSRIAQRGNDRPALVVGFAAETDNVVENARLKRQMPAILISAGIAFRIGDPEWCALVLPRSGLAHRRGLVLGNTVGVIDADYEGPCLISAWNRNPGQGGGMIEIRPGDRIAQLVFTRISRPDFTIVPAFSAEGGRQDAGFGSTGVEA